MSIGGPRQGEAREEGARIWGSALQRVSRSPERRAGCDSRGKRLWGRGLHNGQVCPPGQSGRRHSWWRRSRSVSSQRALGSVDWVPASLRGAGRMLEQPAMMGRPMSWRAAARMLRHGASVGSLGAMPSSFSDAWGRCSSCSPGSASSARTGARKPRCSKMVPVCGARVDFELAAGGLPDSARLVECHDLAAWRAPPTVGRRCVGCRRPWVVDS